MAEISIAQNTETTTIASLHKAWEAANAAYDATDEAMIKPDTTEITIRNSHLMIAQSRAFRQAGFLQQSILRAQPVTWLDAVILAGHIASFASGIDTTVDDHRKNDFEALDLATEALFVFMAGETGAEFGGYLASTLRCCRNSVNARTGEAVANG